MKPPQQQQQDLLTLAAHLFMPAAEAVGHQIDAYDRRQFNYYEAEIGDWRGLFLAKANSAFGGQRRTRRVLRYPLNLNHLRSNSTRNRAHARWAISGIHGDACRLVGLRGLAHGRPKNKLSPQEREAFDNRKGSFTKKSLKIGQW